MIIRRAKDKWGLRVYDSSLHQQVWLGTFPTKKDAERAEAQWKLEQGNGIDPLTIARLHKRWLTEWAREKGWRESTLLHNKERTKLFADKHGRRRADGFTRSDAVTWAHEHPGSVGAVRAMFGFAEELEAVHRNPFSNIGRRKARPQFRELGRGALTEEEVDRMAALATEMHGDWHGALVIFAAYTCLREGENFAVRLRDLDGKRVHVREQWSSKAKKFTLPKNGRERDAYYPQIARSAVNGMLHRFVPGDEDPFAFVNPRDRNHFKHSSYGYYWRPLRAVFEATLPPAHWIKQRVAQKGSKGHLVFHELRHTGATILLERGLSHADVAEQMGHTDGGALVRSTYGHPSREAAFDRIEQALDPKVAVLRVAGTHTAQEVSA